MSVDVFPKLRLGWWMRDGDVRHQRKEVLNHSPHHHHPLGPYDGDDREHPPRFLSWRFFRVIQSSHIFCLNIFTLFSLISILPSRDDDHRNDGRQEGICHLSWQDSWWCNHLRMSNTCLPDWLYSLQRLVPMKVANQLFSSFLLNFVSPLLWGQFWPISCRNRELIFLTLKLVYIS